MSGHDRTSTSTPATPARHPRSRGGLWRLVAGPTIWAVHFLLSYVTVAIHCAKASTADAPLDDVGLALWAYTVVALAAIAVFGWFGWRQHRHEQSSLPHDEATPGDRHRFLGFATMLLCGLSFVAVVYAAFAIAMFGTCR